MIDPRIRWCPACGASLEITDRFGRQRPVCPRCGYVVFFDPKVVVVTVVWQGEQVLLARRNMEPARGEWSFISGYVDRGEMVEDAARREVCEETGLTVSVDRLIGVYSTAENPFILIVFSAELRDVAQTLIAQDDEVSELMFFAIDALPTLAFPTDTQILHDWRTLRNAPQ